MDKEFEARLAREFPMLYRHYLDETSCMSRGFEIGQGWFVLVHELSQEIEKAAEKFGITNLVSVSQVKEKFGGLRFHVRVGTDEDDQEDKSPQLEAAAVHIQLLARKAEQKSMTICETCGRSGQLKQGSWWHVSCDSCETKKQESKSK